MENSIKEVTIIAVKESSFKDKSTGEIKKYWKCNSVSDNKDFLSFNVYNEKPLEGQKFLVIVEAYNFKAVVRFKPAEVK